MGIHPQKVFGTFGYIPTLLYKIGHMAAVVVAAHMSNFVQKGWDIPKGTKYFLWMDAKVVCRWLCQYNIKETFIHNRVKQIRELVSKGNTFIKYVPSELNPADLITKEQDAKKFSTNSGVCASENLT